MGSFYYPRYIIKANPLTRQVVIVVLIVPTGLSCWHHHTLCDRWRVVEDATTILVAQELVDWKRGFASSLHFINSFHLAIILSSIIQACL